MDASPILSEYYAAIRREIEDLIRRRDQYVVLLLAAVGLVFGLVANKPDLSLVLLILPLLSGYAGALYAQADRTIGAHVRWLRKEYVPGLKDHGFAGPTPWEASDAYTTYVAKRGAFFLRYITTSGILVSTSVLSAALGCSGLESYFNGIVSVVVSVILALVGLGGAIQPVFAYQERTADVEPKAKNAKGHA